MIKFFRHIRFKLISENKASRYFKYAIGEIILVVIGILIALQLNTWKEEKQNTKAERAYLKGIITDVKQDITELSSRLERDSTIFKAYTDVLMPFKDPSIKIYSLPFLRAINGAQKTNQFVGNSIVFEDMKASGTINHIQSDVLRFSLLEYYNLSEETIEKHKKNIALIEQLKDKAFTVNLDLNSLIEGFIFKEKFSAQLDDLDLSFFRKDKSESDVKEFANRVSLMKGLLLSNHGNSNNLIDRAQKLKTLLEKYMRGEVIDFKFKLTPEITQAIQQKDTTILQKLIDQYGINSCFNLGRNNFAMSLVAVSIEQNSLESLQFLINNEADKELACYDKTPLMYAVKYGYLDMVKYLLEKGANIETISVEDKTALDYAIKYRHPKIEKFLRNYNQ